MTHCRFSLRPGGRKTEVTNSHFLTHRCRKLTVHQQFSGESCSSRRHHRRMLSSVNSAVSWFRLNQHREYTKGAEHAACREAC